MSDKLGRLARNLMFDEIAILRTHHAREKLSAIEWAGKHQEACHEIDDLRDQLAVKDAAIKVANEWIYTARHHMDCVREGGDICTCGRDKAIATIDAALKGTK